MSETLITTLDARSTVSLPEVAKQLGVPAATVRRWATAGKIPGCFQPAGDGTMWRFKRLELEAWWAKQGLKNALQPLTQSRQPKRMIPSSRRRKE